MDILDQKKNTTAGKWNTIILQSGGQYLDCCMSVTTFRTFMAENFAMCYVTLSDHLILTSFLNISNKFHVCN